MHWNNECRTKIISWKWKKSIDTGIVVCAFIHQFIHGSVADIMTHWLSVILNVHIMFIFRAIIMVSLADRLGTVRTLIRINDVLINHRLRKTPNTINHCNPIYFGRWFTIVSWLQLTLGTPTDREIQRARSLLEKTKVAIRVSVSVSVDVLQRAVRIRLNSTTTTATKENSGIS